ncbi:MAG: sugar phosphate nucleotidyltransferase [Candidatus Eisenbacteria bacterium]|nr:sugar phosphate nucleotidyltransferase [Candidatus Eisenbacteria bacterium]
MAGGRGERFWPLSRASSPKQLLPIVGRRSLLESTVSRIVSLVPPTRIYVITSKHLQSEVAKRLAGFRGITVVGEPAGKNTAPAIGLASSLISMVEPDAVTLVVPSDHMVKGKREFISDVRKAVRVAQSRKLVVFGIKPDRPETGYGYVQVGGRAGSVGKGVFTVRSFVEKPDHKNAVRLLRSGCHYWNSGMFVWRVDALLGEIRKHLPALAKSIEAFSSESSGRSFRERLDRFYSGVEAVSIDYGLLERSSDIVMVRASFSWDDVGSWLSLERILSKDKRGNVLSGETVAVDTRNCVLVASSGVVATLGVENLVVVRTENATLVCAKERAQGIKKISRILSSSKKLKRHL